MNNLVDQFTKKYNAKIKFFLLKNLIDAVHTTSVTDQRHYSRTGEKKKVGYRKAPHLILTEDNLNSLSVFSA